MNEPKIVAIIQARMGSTRLPGKIMLDLLGKPVLYHVVQRVRAAKEVYEVVVATTINPEDKIVESFCRSNDIKVYRGSVENVLSRYYEAAKLHKADIIVRITSDCPLIDPFIIDEMLRKFSQQRTLGKEIDYFSNTLTRTFPRGLDVEIFTFNALERANREATRIYEREHVTPYFYEHPDLFTVEGFEYNGNLSYHRWTLDVREDYELIQKIYSLIGHLKSLAALEDVLQVFHQHPGLMKINSGIKQKALTDASSSASTRNGAT